MKCPHCLVEFHDKPLNIPVGRDKDAGWGVVARKCPSCDRLLIHLAQGDITRQSGTVYFNNPRHEVLVRPKAQSRIPIPAEVPKEFTEDYREACLVLADSPKASAALSRRCLQHILRERAGIKKGNLADEIQEVLDSGNLPSHLSESLDSIRNLGNFAAHPIKSQSTGEIVSVEPGEAEWNLDVIESLFDFYFVQPELLKKKRAALNKKLADAGRPKMK